MLPVRAGTKLGQEGRHPFLYAVRTKLKIPPDFCLAEFKFCSSPIQVPRSEQHVKIVFYFYFFIFLGGGQKGVRG